MDDKISRKTPTHLVPPPTVFPHSGKIPHHCDVSSHKRGAEHLGGRSIKRLQMSKWRPVIPNPFQGIPTPFLASLGAKFAAKRDIAIGSHLVPSSVNTYQSGVDAFTRFALAHNIPEELFSLGAAIIFATMEYYICYLREKHLAAKTISDYITHLSTVIREKGLPDTTLLRNKRISYMLNGWKKQDERRIPERLRVKIPLSADIMWRLFALIDEWFASSPSLRLLYRAAFSFGFGLGLRPREYISPSSVSDSDIDATDVEDDESEQPIDHTLRGSDVFFQWAGAEVFHPATTPTNFPKGKPEFLHALLDSSKNDPAGKGAPRSLFKAPPGSKFDCLGNIFNFLRQFPPKPNSHILSGLPETRVSTGMINKVLKRAARSLGLDPRRLLPHSIRVGSSSQTDSMPLNDRLMHTNHRSIHGAMTYFRKTSALAKRTAPHLHDVSVLPLSSLVLTYMTPSHK